MILDPYAFLQTFKTKLETYIQAAGLNPCPVIAPQIDPMVRDIEPKPGEHACYLSIQPVEHEVSEEGCFDSVELGIDLSFVSELTINSEVKQIIEIESFSK